MTARRISVPAAAALLLLLTYLLVEGASPDAARHERTLDALRVAILNDAALQRDMLQARAGLLHNYDPLVRSVENLREAVDELRTAGATAPEDMRAEVDRRIDGVAAAVADQEGLVEQFKSRNALLQNSLSYFIHVSQQFRPAGADDGDAVMAEVGTLTSTMLRLTSDPRGQTAGEVTASLDRLARLPMQANGRDSLRTLDAHGRLIVATLPSVDDLVSRMLAAPITERTRALQNVYLAVHGRAVAQANLFRILLYIAAVALAAYVARLFVRLRANARTLQERVDFEHLITATSAHFINLAHERIDEGISGGLARLAEHVGADRADIVLDGRDDGGSPASYAWRRAGIDAPNDHAEKMTALALRWSLGEYERHGCVHVPDVARLPGRSERSHLLDQGIRAWVCAPMWCAGKRVGFLMLDTVDETRRWPDDDVALLRTMGDIFATALERKRTDQEREALETRLHQAQRLEAVGTLAGGIAHEFNNILGAMLGHAEMALMAPGPHGSTQRHVRQIMKAGERARTVIDQVLTFSRRRERRHRPIAAQPVVAEAIELLRASLPATLSVQTNLRSTDARLQGDPAQLQQVVMNLCTNAAQAMDARGTVEVDLDTIESSAPAPLSHGSLAAGRYIRLTVADRGHGIDAATMQRMFEPFFTTKAAGSGTGLGLPTVHGIVTEHHGAIDVKSAPGAGTTFAAYFPQTDECPVREEESQASAPPGNGQTILLVDDEKSLVLLGEEMLATLGYEPVGFDDSRAALAAFRAKPERFDLVLTDEVMPDMTGTELAGALHRLRPDLPIVLMTGYIGHAESDRGRPAGICEVLRKPLLSATIAQCLARHLH
jgi:signal transduction histidine kinase/CheY-like chemotaxis protein